MPETETRIIVRIDISPRAADRLSAVCDRFGCTHVTMFSRLVEWYAQLPQTVRHALIGLEADPKKGTRAVLQHMLQKNHK